MEYTHTADPLKTDLRQIYETKLSTCDTCIFTYIEKHCYLLPCSGENGIHHRVTLILGGLNKDVS